MTPTEKLAKKFREVGLLAMGMTATYDWKHVNPQIKKGMMAIARHVQKLLKQRNKPASPRRRKRKG